MRMRRGFRRRRNNVSWFPTLQQEPDIPEGCTGTTFVDWPNWLIGSITVNPSADCPGEKTQVIDLTWDFPVEEELFVDQVPSLADFQGSGWRLRRMVGNLTVAAFDISQTQTQVSAQPCMIGAGLIVLKVDDGGNPLQPDASYSPLKWKNIRDPWAWRRTWVLQPNYYSAGGFIEHQTYPATNVEYGTAVGGPYFDAKTNRRIGQEERLFLCIDAQRRNFSAIPQSVATSIEWTLDYRLLGNLMKETNRRNASR